MNIKIDAEFSALIPPLSADESLQLKQNLLDEGCRDALIVWGDILIDGHNRLKICDLHGLQYQIVNKDFAGRGDAKIYIITNQFGRRNLSIANRSILALGLKKAYSEQAKRNQRCSQGRGQKGSPPVANLFNGVDTREKMAEVAGVSHATIGRVEQILNEGTPEQIDRIKTGGKGNTVTEVHREIRKPVPKPQEPLKPARDPPQQAPAPPKPIPAAPLSDPPFVPDMSIKERNRNIMKHVNALKDPNIERSFTPDMFYVEYKGFVEQFEQNLAVYYCNEYLDIYPEMSSSERERIVALNMKIIALTQKRNEMIRSFTK